MCEDIDYVMHRSNQTLSAAVANFERATAVYVASQLAMEVQQARLSAAIVNWDPCEAKCAQHPGGSALRASVVKVHCRHCRLEVWISRTFPQLHLTPGQLDALVGHWVAMLIHIGSALDAPTRAWALVSSWHASLSLRSVLTWPYYVVCALLDFWNLALSAVPYHWTSAYFAQFVYSLARSTDPGDFPDNSTREASASDSPEALLASSVRSIYVILFACLGFGLLVVSNHGCLVLSLYAVCIGLSTTNWEWVGMAWDVVPWLITADRARLVLSKPTDRREVLTMAMILVTGAMFSMQSA